MRDPEARGLNCEAYLGHQINAEPRPPARRSSPPCSPGAPTSSSIRPHDEAAQYFASTFAVLRDTPAATRRAAAAYCRTHACAFKPLQSSLTEAPRGGREVGEGHPARRPSLSWSRATTAPSLMLSRPAAETKAERSPPGVGRKRTSRSPMRSTSDERGPLRLVAGQRDRATADRAQRADMSPGQAERREQDCRRRLPAAVIRAESPRSAAPQRVGG